MELSGHTMRNERKYKLLKCILMAKVQDKKTNILAKDLKNLV